MRIFLNLLLGAFWAAHASEVVLDPSFGGTGVVRPAFENLPSMDSMGTGRSAAVQADGKVVLVGTTVRLGVKQAMISRLNADGTRDLSFGTQGTYVLPTERDAELVSVRIQADGSILAAGRFSVGLYIEMLVIKLTPSGALDSTFANAGILLISGDGDDAEAHGLAFDAEGRGLVAGFVMMSGRQAVRVVRFSQAGVLDASFGSQGKATFTLGSSPVQAREVVVQPDGRVLAGGFATISGRERFLLVAFQDSGQVDYDFAPDDSGHVTTSVGGSGADSRMRALALLPDGRILAGGMATASGTPRAALARYSSDGALDTTFGSSGTTITNWGSTSSQESQGMCLLLLSDGKCLLTGHLNTGSAGSLVASRYTSAGVLDSSFGTSGRLTVSFGSINTAGGAVVPAVDGFILAGTIFAPSGISSAGLAHFSASGQLLPAFGVSGKLELNLRTSPSYPQGYSIVEQPDGRVLAAGSVLTEAGFGITVVRRLADGSADAAFGTDGKVFLQPGDEAASASSMLLQPDGRILIGGSAYEAGKETAVVLRLEPDGSLDATFGNAGVFMYSAATTDHRIEAMCLLPDGKIVAAGYGHLSTGVAQFVAWRLTTAGLLDSGFGPLNSPIPGTITTHVQATNRNAYGSALALLADGKILLAGTSYTDSGSTASRFGVVRLTAAGLVDTTFTGSGRVQVQFSGFAAYCRKVSITSSGQILLSGHVEAGLAGSGGAVSFAAARLNSAGAADATYGLDGKVQISFSGWFWHYAEMALLDSQDRCLLAGRVVGATTTLPAFIRLTAAGQLDTGFGQSGLAVFSGVPGGRIQAMAPASAEGGLWLTGYEANSLILMKAGVLTPNASPTAVSDTRSALPGRTVLVNVLANDTDADGDNLSIQSFTQPAQGGTVSLQGQLLAFTAAPNFTGATFSYTAHDGKGGTDTATVTLVPVTTYAQWLSVHFGDDDEIPGTTGPQDDPDADGLTNIAEYALNRDPGVMDSSAIFTSCEVIGGSLVVEYHTWAAASDVQVQPEFCTDFPNWQGAGVNIQLLQDDGIQKTWRATAPLPVPATRQFGRLAVYP